MFQNFSIEIYFFVIGLIFLLGIRTLLWHAQCWQIREYRIDRMRAYFYTNEGKRNFWNFWFFHGILPRPKISGRIFMIFGIFGFFNILLFAFIFSKNFSVLELVFVFLCWERTLFLQIMLSVFLSAFPVEISKKILFRRAQKIIQNSAKNITRIGITGSYGKSSTKEILVHLLQTSFGLKNVLFNPANENNEVAIARLILKNQNFFKKSSIPQDFQKNNQKFLVIEIGAYKKWEISKVCDFVLPHIGILTGLNQQHLELFGSFENIKNTKFELAEHAQKIVFFNADNEFLSQIFSDREILATKVPIGKKAAENILSESHQTSFECYNEKFVLPWPGSFFVQNTLLALECARELGIPKKNLPNLLKNLPPLERALSLEKHALGFSILKDTYSANPNGVLAAVEHLSCFPGKKFFIGIPLLELSTESQKIHVLIFEKLKKIGAKVFWLKDDFSTTGKQILGDDFQKIDRANPLKRHLDLKTLNKTDVVLLESKLPKEIFEFFGK